MSERVPARRLAAVSAALILAAVGQRLSASANHDQFAFLRPQIVISDAERQRLDRDDVIVEMLPGKDRQVGIFVATRLRARPDAVVLWTRAIHELRRSRFVLASGRFSDPPQLADVSGLALEDDDLEALRECVAGDCGVKLGVSEIESVRRVMAAAGSAWRPALQAEFRRLLVVRAHTYKTGGLAALPATADGKSAQRPQQVFTGITLRSPYLHHVPIVATWLHRYPHTEHPVESFLYWSKEHYGTGKPVISITQVGILHQGPESPSPAVVVTGKQIFASHYLDGALGTTMVLHDASRASSYLVYLNRSELDVLGGVFGGLTRAVLERRLKREAPQVVRSLRLRLESGSPPPVIPETR